MASAQSRLDRWLPWTSAGVLSAAALYLTQSVGEPLRMNWGDPWSDANVQTSGRIFARDGFIKNAFTPTLDVEPLTPEALRYTHYPPLPDLINGVEQRIFGARDISFYRVFALAMSFAAMVLFFRWVRRLWGRETALFATPLFASNLLFLEYADTIHHVPIYWSTGFGALAAAAAWLTDGRRGALAATFVAIFLCLFASYDFYFFLPLSLLATVLVLRVPLKDGRVRALLAVSAGAALLSVSAKTLCVIWAVGAKEFWADFVFQFFERATARHADDYTGAFQAILIGRAWRFFGPLVLVAFVAQLHAVAARWWRDERTTDPTPLWLLVAGVPFIALFTQLFCEQYHAMLQLLPYYAVGVGSVLARLWGRATARAQALALGALLFCGVWQVVEVVRFPKTFFEREDIAAVRKILDDTDTRRFVLTNAIVDASVRNYWNRHSLTMPYSREPLQAHNLFDIYGHDGPITVIEFTDIADEAYDKGMYRLFAPERRWPWVADPFPYRHEWRARMDALRKSVAESGSYLGTVVYESKNLRVRSMTLEGLDKVQRALVPEEETRFIDFETKWADRHKLYGFGAAEQYDRQHGFAWLQARTPIELIFTLQGLRPKKEHGEPIRTSALRVRLAPGRDYQLTAVGWTEFKEQTLTLRVNGAIGETIAAGAPNGVRIYELTIRGESLRADGIQDLEFSYPLCDRHGNGLLLHSVRFDPATPAR